MRWGVSTRQTKTQQYKRHENIESGAWLCLLPLRWRFFCDTTNQVFQLLNPSSFHDYLMSKRTLKRHRCLTCGHFLWADDYTKIGIAGDTRGTSIVSNKFALVAHWHRGRFSDGVWKTTKRQHANVQTNYSMFHYLGDTSICFGRTIACSKCALHQQCVQTDAAILSVSRHRVFLIVG